MLKIISVIIGTLIGAGFASGREIYVFFTQYGRFGLVGIFLTGIITSFLIYKVFDIVKTYEINNYNKFLEMINWKHDRLNKVINTIVSAFLLFSFYIMVAGFSSYIQQTYSISKVISSIIFLVVCYFIFRKNIEGVVKINELLVPILIILILLLGIKNIFSLGVGYSKIQQVEEVKNTILNNWLVLSILYASYNSIILIPVLTALREYIKSKKQIIKISIYSGISIIFLALIIYSLLLNNISFVSKLDMPLIEVVKQFGIFYKYLYELIIISSIFTSAISTGYSFLKNVAKSKDSYKAALILMCISSIFVSNIGFSNLVKTLYPIFGILGLIQIYLIQKFRIY